MSGENYNGMMWQHRIVRDKSNDGKWHQWLLLLFVLCNVSPTYSTCSHFAINYKQSTLDQRLSSESTTTITTATATSLFVMCIYQIKKKSVLVLLYYLFTNISPQKFCNLNIFFLKTYTPPTPNVGGVGSLEFSYVLFSKSIHPSRKRSIRPAFTFQNISPVLIRSASAAFFPRFVNSKQFSLSYTKSKKKSPGFLLKKTKQTKSFSTITKQSIKQTKHKSRTSVATCTYSYFTLGRCKQRLET